MATAVAGTADLLITCDYNDNAGGATPGADWVILHDNPVMSWIIDEAGATPPIPVILGSMPLAPPDTGEVASPPWAVRDKSGIFVPDTMRGSPNEFFNFVASNNGATRKLYAEFMDTNMAIAWNEWSSVNPEIALKDPPNIAPEIGGLVRGNGTDQWPFRPRQPAFPGAPILGTPEWPANPIPDEPSRTANPAPPRERPDLERPVNGRPEQPPVAGAPGQEPPFPGTPARPAAPVQGQPGRLPGITPQPPAPPPAAPLPRE